MITFCSGLAGKTEWEQTKVGMIMECMEHTIKDLTGLFREKDEAKKVKHSQHQLIQLPL